MKSAIKATVTLSILTWVFTHSLWACERKNQEHSAYVEKNELCDDDLRGKKTPSFSEFEVEVESSPQSSIDFSSLPRAENWKKRINDAYSKGMNFSGHYVIASWGCGTGCLQNVIINTKTGKVSHPKEIGLIISRPTRFSESALAKLDISDDGQIHFKKNSSLLIAIGKLGEASRKVGVYHFQWDGKKLNLIQKIERTDPKK